jgi:uncharacterized membrane protein YfcA
LLLLGSTFGAQVGTIIGKRLKGDQIKILLALIVLGVTVKMILDLTSTPDILLAPIKGG